MNPADERWVTTPGFDVRTLADDKFVASVFGAGSDVKRTRAALIAAAPDLLRTVKGFREALVEIHGGQLNQNQLLKLDALIARAEGREA